MTPAIPTKDAAAMTPAFRVLNQDGSEPDLVEITRTEEWAREWFWWTPHEFVVSADGRVFVVDDSAS